MEKKEDVLNQILHQIKQVETATDNYRVPANLANQISTYLSMQQEIALMTIQTQMLLDSRANDNGEVNGPVVQALWHSIVIAYGKLFSQTKSQNAPKLDMNDLFKNNMPLRLAHEYLIDIRNNFIAHRGDSDHEQIVVFLKIPKGKEILSEPKWEYSIQGLKKANPSTDRHMKNLELFNFISKVVEEKLQKQSHKIHKRFFSECGKENILKFKI